MEKENEKSEEEIIERERIRAREEKNNRILEARYKRYYKKILAKGRGPRYLLRGNLEKTNLGEGIRALARLRCGNLEEWNKYWLVEETRKCIFCNRGKDSMEHFIEECGEIKDWFYMIEESKEDIWKKIWSEDLDDRKEEFLVKIWKKKEKLKRTERDRNSEERRLGERKESVETVICDT